VSLRALGFDEHITLLGDEDHRPYQRPALSKEFLQGKVDKENVIFRSADYWNEHNITVVKGERIERIEKAPDGSGTAFAASGTQYPFSRLALTVGARARRLDVPGTDLDGVVYLRNADDALDLKARLGKVREAVVIGGGFIGLEAASSLHSMGIAVTVLEYGPRLVGRAVGEETSDFFLQAHRKRGLDIRVDARIVRLVPSADGRSVKASSLDGGVVPSGAVGIGVVPNTELAEQLGLDVTTARRDRYALPPMAPPWRWGMWPTSPTRCPGTGRRTIRLRAEQRDRAREVVITTVGRRGLRGHPMVLVHQADLKLQIAA
jgi:3-phenylpropionate/trans-cinnamate dioxygenase ferredoxin reductase subunit